MPDSWLYMQVTFATTIGFWSNGRDHRMWSQECHFAITHLRITLFHPACMLEVRQILVASYDIDTSLS